MTDSPALWLWLDVESTGLLDSRPAVLEASWMVGPFVTRAYPGRHAAHSSKGRLYWRWHPSLGGRKVRTLAIAGEWL